MRARQTKMPSWTPKAQPEQAPDASPAVVVLADAGDVSDSLQAALARRGHRSIPTGSLEEATDCLARRAAHLVVVVLPLRGGRGREAIRRIKEIDSGVPFIVVGVDADVTRAGEAFDLGAQEHLFEAPLDLSDFLTTVGVVLGSRRGDRHLQYLRTKDSPGSWDDVLGDSPALHRVLKVLRQLCARSFSGGTPTILLAGETGTGKGFIAKCLHYNGIRRNRPFVEVNCAALPPTLIETELFGHERGSFTDAKASRAGFFEMADGGTLFLDEISTIPVDLQAKLLTAIEEKMVRRIGARKSARVNVQVVAATHEDLQARVRAGTFREDLFHRLNVVRVTMPPLRERGADVVLLAEGFLRQFCGEYGMPPRRLDGGACAWLSRYAWPGNVRELRNQMERVVLLEDDDLVTAEQLAPSVDATVRVRENPGGGSTKLRVSLPPGGLPFAVLECEVLREALERNGGNISRAARFLSMSRQTLMYRMKKFGLG